MNWAQSQFVGSLFWEKDSLRRSVVATAQGDALGKTNPSPRQFALKGHNRRHGTISRIHDRAYYVQHPSSVALFKTRTSAYFIFLFGRALKPFAWQNGYGAFSVSAS